MVALTDPSVPANQDLLGELKGVKKDELQWKRIQEACKESPKLWGQDGPHPGDISQGAIGDCWMVSAFASVARSAPHLIKKLFVSPKDQSGEPCISPDGKYTIQLWDVDNGRWEQIAIDDVVFATKSAKAHNGILLQTARPRNNNIWPVLLEKAFAKFMSTYRASEGGWHTAAFAAIAGDLSKGIFQYRSEPNEDKWTPKMRVVSAKDGPRTAPNGLTIRSMYTLPAENVKPLTPEEMLQEVRGMLEDSSATYVMGASSSRAEGGDTQKTEGIVHSHAYTVLGVLYPDQLKAGGELEGLTLIKLLNPHGRTEWEGDWRDDDDKWQKYPEVAKACGHDGKPRNDGMFWMSKEDFAEMFIALSILRLDRQAGDKNLNKDAGRQAAGGKAKSAWPGYKFIFPAAQAAPASSAKPAVAQPAAAKPAGPAQPPAAAPAAAKPAAAAPAAAAAKPAAAAATAKPAAQPTAKPAAAAAPAAAKAAPSQPTAQAPAAKPAAPAKPAAAAPAKK